VSKAHSLHDFLQLLIAANMINEMSFHKHFFQISLMKDGSRP